MWLMAIQVTNDIFNFLNRGDSHALVGITKVGVSGFFEMDALVSGHGRVLTMSNWWLPWVDHSGTTLRKRK